MTQTLTKPKHRRRRNEASPEKHRPGMGAILYKNRKGAAFRVWAPNADAVHIAGDFNEWDDKATPLVSEGNGYWYVDLRNARPGQEYKYVIKNGKNVFHKNDPYARKVTSSIGNSVIYDPEAFDWGKKKFQMAPWNEVVIYEMHIGTFNAKHKDRPGDFASAIEKLPYLQKLGINAVEVMPIAEFPGGYSWGYNPAHPYAVESDYGGPDAFKEFVKAAHEHGIAVILDVVYNHFGPTDVDLWQFDGWSENELGGIYFYNDWRAETPWGSTRPDYGRPEVRSYIADNVMMWLEEYRVDGLRWDGTVFIRNQNFMGGSASDLPDGWSLMQYVNEQVQAKHPGKLMISEDLQGNEWLTKTTGEGGAGFGSQWDSNFVHPLREVVITQDDHSRDMHKLLTVLETRYGLDSFARVIYSESHDEVANGKARLPEEIWPDNVDSYFSKKRSVLGAAIVFTAPGIPMLFQGQEFLEDKWFSDTDPLDWSRVKEFSGLVNLYKELISMRRNLKGLTRGLSGQEIQIIHVNHDMKLIAFQRWKDGGSKDTTVVIANFSNETRGGYTIGLPLGGQWKVRFNSDWEGFDEDFTNQFTGHPEAKEGERDGLPFHGTVDVGPYSVLVLSQD